MTCHCPHVEDAAVIDMTAPYPLFRTLRDIKRRGNPWWWLGLSVCQECRQGWLVASEEAQNDVYCLLRLTKEQVTGIVEQEQWPTDFDRYEVLLEMGRAAGHAVRFGKGNDSPLIDTVKLLAEQRPGISVRELARLLNLTVAEAERIAQKVVNTARVSIQFVGS